MRGHESGDVVGLSPSWRWIPLNLSIDALATLLHRIRRYPIVLGKLRLHDEKGLLATRPPVISDRESHFKRQKPMVGTLRELSTTMVA